VPTGTYLDMSANLPIVDPLKVQAPVLLGRAGSLWMVKRVLADGWDEQRALTEANALGLNDRFRPFALNYIHPHAK
jgi:hypothetical protein